MHDGPKQGPGMGTTAKGLSSRSKEASAQPFLKRALSETTLPEMQSDVIHSRCLRHLAACVPQHELAAEAVLLCAAAPVEAAFVHSHASLRFSSLAAPPESECPYHSTIPTVGLKVSPLRSHRCTTELSICILFSNYMKCVKIGLSCLCTSAVE